MAHTDPIADMLTRIRNSLKARKFCGDTLFEAKRRISPHFKRRRIYTNYKIVARENKLSDMIIDLKYGMKKERIINGLKESVNQVYGFMQEKMKYPFSWVGWER